MNIDNKKDNEWKKKIAIRWLEYLQISLTANDHLQLVCISNSKFQVYMTKDLHQLELNIKSPDKNIFFC